MRNVLLVLGVNAIASLLPFTPGGAGVQQALLLKVFAGTATSATVAAYSVGQQIAIAAFSLGLGFAALVFIFKFRSFKAVIAAGREHRAAEQARSGAPDEAASRPRGAYCRPARASRTSVTASGKTVAMSERICCACSSALPCTLTRLMAATVICTARPMALSAQARPC